MKKWSKNILALALLTTTLATGLYASNVMARTEAWRGSMRCTCIFPQSGQYGVRVPEDPSGQTEDCQVINCWIPIDI